MKIGYIRRNNLEYNPHLKRFDFKEATFTRRITGKGDRVYSKMLTKVHLMIIIKIQRATAVGGCSQS